MNASQIALQKSLIAKRVKVEKQKAKAHGAQLIANADAELDRRFQLEDLGVEKIAEQVEEKVEALRRELDARFDALGVSRDLRGRIYFGYHPGGSREPAHRSEERRKARVEVEAAVERRITEIEAWEYEALTALATKVLTPEDAEALMAMLPEVTEALPAVTDIIGPVEEQPLAVIESGREAKRRAILKALGTDGSRSDREIGRLIGVDHKTVAKVRAQVGELPAASGDLPTLAGEIPTAAEEA
ncbi:hypothetical protein [Nocardioides sp. KR10-350]|uniref:hypothetical protein n=1 Tax=Nocardioides cheoyonin TaxID=3156615 RepID=UPI0032B57E1E